MISDTLHDALAEIEDYQGSMPKCYDGLRDEIGKVKTVMSAMRAFLHPLGAGKGVTCESHDRPRPPVIPREMSR